MAITLFYYCYRAFPGAKSNFMTKGVPIGIEMTEKHVNKQTDKNFHIYISRYNTVIVLVFVLFCFVFCFFLQKSNKYVYNTALESQAIIEKLYFKNWHRKEPICHPV